MPTEEKRPHVDSRKDEDVESNVYTRLPCASVERPCIVVSRADDEGVEGCIEKESCCG